MNRVNLAIAAALFLPAAAWAVAPVSADQSVTVVTGCEAGPFMLSITDPDTYAWGPEMTVTILSGPSHGAIESLGHRYSWGGYNNYLYYRANAGFVGTDSFTWKCNDGTGESGIATVSVMVNPNTVPVATNSSVTAVTGADKNCGLSITDPDVSQPKTYSVVSGPAHGSVRTNSGALYYKSKLGYVGSDSFTWKCNDGVDDSNVATCTVTVTANNAPVANDSSQSLPSFTRYSVYLWVAHPDAGQTLTFTLVSGPSHGVVQMPVPMTYYGYGGYGYAYYTSDKDYVGGDSFTWKVSDGIDESAATATITVAAVAPVPENQTACVVKDTATDIPARYTGGGGYDCTAVVVPQEGYVAYPMHGTVAVTNGTTLRYVPEAGYSGPDFIKWKISYSDGTTVRETDAVWCSIYVKESTGTTDWPQWRADENRTAAVTWSLPANLYQQWRRDYPATVPARVIYSYRYNSQSPTMERCLWSVGQGKTLYVALGISDCVAALDTDTGVEKWRFYANGPVRGAPAALRLGSGSTGSPQAGQAVVCFGSDDGWVYCLDGASGQLVWKKQVGPTNRKVFGDSRMISPWMARNAGPLVAGGKVYVFSGFWVSEGMFGYALDAATGAEIWKNDSLSWAGWNGAGGGGPERHCGYQRGGPTPAGWLRLSYDAQTLYLGCGYEGRAYLSVPTGALISYQGGHAYEYMDGVLGEYTVQGGGGETTSIALSPTPPPAAVTGLRMYGATDAAALGVAGTLGDILAADNKLFAVTTGGSIYCFGGTQVGNPPAYPVTTTPLPGTSDGWTTDMAHILTTTGADDGGVAVVLGAGSRRAVEEVLKQSSYLHVVVVEPDTNKAAGLRTELYGAGLYGKRTSVLDEPATNFGMPSCSGRLILTEDLTTAGFADGVAFVQRVFDWLRPYGGTAWLPTTDGQHASLSGWVASANLANAELTRDGSFSVLKKVGPPPSDRFKGPLGTQWFGDQTWHNPQQGGNTGGGGIIDDHYRNADLYTGFRTRAFVGVGYNPHGPSGKWSGFGLDGMTTNPWTGVAEGLLAQVVSGSCQASWADTNNWVLRSTSEMLWYDPVTVSGGVFWPSPAETCGAGGYNGGDAGFGAIGNGVLYASRGAWGQQTGVALMPAPDVENWAFWGDGPSRAFVDDKPIRQMGVNFGAPGDWHAGNGTLWLEYPMRESKGRSPNFPLSVKGALQQHYHHSSRLKSGVEKRVQASNVAGATNITVALAQPVVARAAAQAPAIDGVLSDACWDGRIPVMLSDSYSMNPALVWTRYDANNLYLAMRNDEASEFHVYLSNRDNYVPSAASGGAIWGVNRYAHFTVTSAGVMSQTLGQSHDWGGEVSWTGTWTSAVATTGGYTVEAAIPWSTVEAAGLWKENLIVNIMTANLWVPGKRLRELRHDGNPTATAPMDQGSGNPVPCSWFCPLFLDAARGDLAYPVTGTVRLHFAETEGATAGQRVFDVKVQGQTVLANYDIFSDADGADRGLVKEFALTTTSNVVVELAPKAGETLIAGVEFVGSYPARVNQSPVAVITASANSGPAPLTVTVDAGQSTDPDGQIAGVDWAFGDGTSATGWKHTHTYSTPGSYTVVLRVTDTDGAPAMAITTITVTGSGTAADFVCKIRASGGDYDKLSTWQAAIVSDLTAANSLVFTVTDRGTYDPAIDDGQTVTFTGSTTSTSSGQAGSPQAGGGSGTLKHVNVANKAYIVGCANAAAGVVKVAGGHTFTVGDAGGQVVRAIAECYNDWPNGLYDNTSISGWTANADHYVKIYVPPSERHPGKPFKADGVTCSGFTLVNNVSYQSTLGLAQGWTRVDGVALRGQLAGGPTYGTGGLWASPGDGTSVWFTKGLIYRAGYGSCSIWNGYGRLYLSNTIVIEDQGGGGIQLWGGDAVVYNCTFVNGRGIGIVGRWNGVLRNVLSAGNAGGDFTTAYGALNMKCCASSDGTADDWGGAGNRANQTFSFVASASNDFHLAVGDTGARDWGTADVMFDPNLPITDDMDGEFRTDGKLDIGADEAFGDAGADAYGIPDSWKIQHFGSATAPGSGALEDPDHDGMNNLQEYIAGTNPRDAGSRFQCSVFSVQGGEFLLRFLTETGRLYGVVEKDDLTGTSQWVAVTNGMPGTGGYVEVRDPATGAKKFYRVTVSLP